MATIPEVFAEAVQNYQAGHRRTAESVCHQILAIDPAYWQALHLAAVIARDSGRNEIAAGFLARAIAANSSIAALHHDLGPAHEARAQAARARHPSQFLPLFIAQGAHTKGHGRAPSQVGLSAR